MNTHPAGKPPRRKREHLLIALTTLILACVVVVVAGNLFPLAAANQKNAKLKEPNRPSLETPKANNTGSVGNFSGIIVGPASDPAQRTPSEGEPQEPLVTESGHAAARLKSNLAPSSGSSFSEFVGPIILIMASVFALAILAILVLILCVFGLLRWHHQRFGPLIRIEHLGSPSIAVDSFNAKSPPRQASVQATKPADFGPAFAQEHQHSEAPEASAHQPQDPLVQRLFEEALQLQTQIDLAREERQQKDIG